MNCRFLTNYYYLIKLIKENTITINNETYCPLLQEEMSQNIGVSRMTINKMCKELIEEGYLINIGKSRLSLTDKGKDIFNKINL